MPLGTPTKTVQDVVTAVQRQFGDESGVQITSVDILRWVNQAQMEICNKNPILQATATSTTIVGQQTYSVPLDIIQVESLMFAGNILEPRNFEGIRLELGEANSEQGVPQFWYTWRDLLYLWPIPDSADLLEVNYSRKPVAVTTVAALLDLPDRYYERVCEFCKAKAYELDEDWSAQKIERDSFDMELNAVTNADKNMIGAFFVARDSEYEN